MNKIAKRLFLFSAALFFLWPFPEAQGAFLYKNYIIRQDRGVDILCDPYVVQKDDWVIKIFQRRGQIADQDFPEFLKIFAQLNPNIENVNKIIPGQHILIPLKKLPKDSLPGQASGFVTIPFVTVSKIPDMVKDNSYTYKVKPGDYVSGIISQTYGKNSNLGYNEAIQLFKLINPNITNLDRIYPGQVLNIPDRTLGNKALYDTLFSDSGVLLNNPEIAINTPASSSPETKPQLPVQDSFNNSSFVTVASILDAKLIYQGKFFFPREGQEDLILDLSRYPVMELPDGKRILFSEENDMTLEDQAFIQKQWNGVSFVTLPRESGFDKIMDSVLNLASEAESYQDLSFDDYGVIVHIVGKWMVKSGTTSSITDQIQNPNQPYTFISITYPNDMPIPDAIKRYFAKFNILLKEIAPTGEVVNKLIFSSEAPSNPDKKFIDAQSLKMFVRGFVGAINFQYTENTDISFPYAGVQVNAVSNVISSPDGQQVLADYGDLYGDAVSSIENTGLRVLQFTDKMEPVSIIQTILQKFNLKYSEIPKITAVSRSGSLEVSFEIPGFTCKSPQGVEYLITTASLNDHLTEFLNDRGYEIILFSNVSFSQKNIISNAETPTSLPN